MSLKVAVALKIANPLSIWRVLRRQAYFTVALMQLSVSAARLLWSGMVLVKKMLDKYTAHYAPNVA